MVIFVPLINNEFKQFFTCLLAFSINYLFAFFAHFFFCWDHILFLLIHRSSLNILDGQFIDFEKVLNSKIVWNPKSFR